MIGQFGNLECLTVLPALGHSIMISDPNQPVTSQPNLYEKTVPLALTAENCDTAPQFAFRGLLIFRRFINSGELDAVLPVKKLKVEGGLAKLFCLAANRLSPRV